ncbi:MAG TPA: glucose-6-phosphate dehydrogenase [Eubacteriaceae bacterium]|nr:glucose-6-phosphate dehydrogenase [Eubacteriaceae bacterium]
MDMKIDPCTLVIFGATGNLATEKILPAIYRLYFHGYLVEDLNILCIGRRDLSTDRYTAQLKDYLQASGSLPFKEEVFEEMTSRIVYHQMDFLRLEEYEHLKNTMKSISPDHNYIFYFAVGPQHFTPIVQSLKSSGISSDTKGWQRIMIEKPFGKNLESANALNEEIKKVFREDQIYRIDHYLAKEMIQNITTIRFHNTIFEPLWDNTCIDNVQIVLSEETDVGTRGGYYDQAGAVRDMIQNHMLQTLAVVAMEPPKSMNPEDIRNAKVELFNDLLYFHPETTYNDIVLGQYEGYRQTEKVSQDSTTETFAAMKVHIDNKRWRGVPFYLLTGKALKEKKAQITIEFKEPMYSQQYTIPGSTISSEIVDPPNLLEIHIQPKEGINLKINAKEPSIMNKSKLVDMEYCQSCNLGYNTPDAYEKLLLDVLTEDFTRFTRWDELVLTWSFIDSIDLHSKKVFPYEKQSFGPEESIQFLEKDRRKWHHIKE